MLRPLLAAGLLAAAPAPAVADAPEPAGAFACWQTFASYGPTGKLSGYNRVERGVVTFDAGGRYDVADDAGFAAEGAGAGRWSMRAGKVRFHDGPYWAPEQGWRLVGDLHPGGVRMPHDRRKGTRYELVLRSRPGAQPDVDAPPRAEGRDFVLTFWYCDDQA